MKREDIESKVIDQLCNYCLTKSDDIMEIFDKLIADHKAVVETKDKRILELEQLAESLKCCGNCEHCLTMSQVPNKLHHATYCQVCENNSKWQLAKGIK